MNFHFKVNYIYFNSVPTEQSYIRKLPRGAFLVAQSVKKLPAMQETLGLSSIPGSERSPGEGNGNPLQYSCLENSMDKGVWWVTVQGVTKSQTQLSDFHFIFSQSNVSVELHVRRDLQSKNARNKENTLYINIC